MKMETSRGTRMKVSETVANAVAEFGNEHRNPAKIPIQSPVLYSKTSWWGTPEAGSAGCYVALSEEGTPLYVGKSERAIGDRLAVHFPNPMPNVPKVWIGKTSF